MRFADHRAILQHDHTTSLKDLSRASCLMRVNESGEKYCAEIISRVCKCIWKTRGIISSPTCFQIMPVISIMKLNVQIRIYRCPMISIFNEQFFRSILRDFFLHVYFIRAFFTISEFVKNCKSNCKIILYTTHHVNIMEFSILLKQIR